MVLWWLAASVSEPPQGPTGSRTKADGTGESASAQQVRSECAVSTQLERDSTQGWGRAGWISSGNILSMHTGPCAHAATAALGTTARTAGDGTGYTHGATLPPKCTAASWRPGEAPAALRLEPSAMDDGSGGHSGWSQPQQRGRPALHSDNGSSKPLRARMRPDRTGIGQLPQQPRSSPAAAQGRGDQPPPHNTMQAGSA
jgi:hypothetical protein